ncbi:short-chain collagen C4-like [Mercenaria mercenaria]|uniref:short-chain collagen C4-like n=1 Tax=Mercenaria mercenaria TaxID=6596 RepID=UPI00234E81C6|nr:short-chain collagen C4-like [Mercenaria mercenaria]
MTVSFTFCLLLSLTYYAIDRSLGADSGNECSRFDFDHKLLDSLVRLQQSHAALREELQNLKARTEADKQATIGGNYVRWGRSECPANATTVYKGYTGGSLYTHTGAASDFLCLPEVQQWDPKTENKNLLRLAGAKVYGAEYEMNGDFENFFGKSIHDHNPPCAVCETERPNIMMIPGRTTCYYDWTVEYIGYLAAGHVSHPAASQYICLDEDPEVVASGGTNENGKLLYLAEAKCGSLPCPPFDDGRVLSCVVCSK